MIRYAISDITPHAQDPSARTGWLEAAVDRWSAQGIDYVQLREKSLPAGELFRLAEEFLEELQKLQSSTRLLINSRADVASAAGAHGVHLPSAPGELTPVQVHNLYAAAGRGEPVVSVSCHTAEEAAQAAQGGADLLLFGPVFEKMVGGTSVVQVAPGAGLERLAEAVRRAAPTPVLALGGVTAANAAACLEAGAAGISGIRIFTAGEPTHRLTTK